MNTKIKRILDYVEVDGVEHAIVEVLNDHDLGTHKETITKAESDLWLFILTSIKPHVNYKTYLSLSEKVENYVKTYIETHKKIKKAKEEKIPREDWGGPGSTDFGPGWGEMGG